MEFDSGQVDIGQTCQRIAFVAKFYKNEINWDKLFELLVFSLKPLKYSNQIKSIVQLIQFILEVSFDLKNSIKLVPAIY